MYHVSAQGIDEHMINVHYYYIYKHRRLHAYLHTHRHLLAYTYTLVNVSNSTIQFQRLMTCRCQRPAEVLLLTDRNNVTVLLHADCRRLCVG